jgi:ribonuclease HII
VEEIANSSYPSELAGVDEVGRGPLAGPVVVSAVSFPEGSDLSHFTDSKKVTKRNRDRFCEEILSLASRWVVVGLGPTTIDSLNILGATRKAMVMAIEEISLPLALVDGNMKLETSRPYRSIIKGDQLHPEIGAASILAKVWRDRLMEHYSEIYPGYHFEKHKGYGTKSPLRSDTLARSLPNPPIFPFGQSRNSPPHESRRYPFVTSMTTWFSRLRETISSRIFHSPKPRNPPQNPPPELSHRELGQWGEELASSTLTQKGYQILDTNWRTAEGELDIICLYRQTLVFVEVKTRRKRSKAYPLQETVSDEKEARIYRLAALYRKKEHQKLRHTRYTNCRF